jgi:hypothetical protein
MCWWTSEWRTGIKQGTSGEFAQLIPAHRVLPDRRFAR